MAHRKTINSPNSISEQEQYGVYSIRVKNKYMYVGMTCNNFYHRWIGHLSKLRNGSHYNKVLQNLYDKYGVKELNFVIEFKSSQAPIKRKTIELKETEVWKAYSQNFKMINSEPRGGTVSHSDETKVLIRKKMKESGKFTSTEKLERNLEKVILFAGDPKKTMVDSAKELEVGYGVLNKFVKDNNIRWVTHRELIKNKQIKHLEESYNEVITLSKDKFLSKTEAAKYFKVSLRNFNQFLYDNNINWNGFGAKPTSLKYKGVQEMIELGKSICEISSRTKLSEDQVRYYKRRTR